MLDGEGLPWLMAPDLTISFAPDGTDVAGYTSSLHETLNPVATTSAWQETFVNAFRTWAQHIGTAVNVVADGGNPFGAPGLTQGDPKFGDVRIAAVPLQSDVIAISIPHNDLVSGTWAGDILLNSNASLDSIDELFSVALHEAGHVFGLGHSTDARSVMHRHGISTVLTPTADDIAALQQLYGRTENFDGYFRQVGVDEDLDDGDDHIDTPRQLVSDQQLMGAIRYDAAGEISSATDVDYYQLGPVDKLLDDALDGLEVLTVTLWMANPQSLVPDVQIVKPSGEALNSRILSNSGGRMVLQADDASPEEEILVKVQAADPGVNPNTGAYRLSARFGATETKLVKMAKGTLDHSGPEATRVLHVSQTSLMHLALEVGRMDRALSATVVAVVSNASGQVVARIDSSPGHTHSAPTFLLDPGDYRVEIAATAPAGRSLAQVAFALRGIAVSMPIGSVISDPTGDPTMICDPGAGPGSTCTPLDPAITTPIIVTPPPLPPHLSPPDAALAGADLLDPAYAGPLVVTNPWFNSIQPLDVNGDGIVSPSDALAIVNYLNNFGMGTLDMLATTALFLDVNGDGRCTAADALHVINALNAPATKTAAPAGASPTPTVEVPVAASPPTPTDGGIVDLTLNKRFPTAKTP